MSENLEKSLEASFSTLILSLGSSAAMAMGFGDQESEPNRLSQDKDMTMAKFQIDLLVVLREKTKNNLTPDEAKFLNQMISDLQLKFVQAS